jgi:hypothetical protein
VYFIGELFFKDHLHPILLKPLAEVFRDLEGLFNMRFANDADFQVSRPLEPDTKLTDSLML